MISHLLCKFLDRHRLVKLQTGVAVWAFHGDNDVIVPSSVSKDLVQELWNSGANKDRDGTFNEFSMNFHALKRRTT